MAQPDPSAARAVIVGVRNYAHLESLPAVANNVARIAELLRHPDLWGLADEHCQVLLDPVFEREVLDAVHKAASEAKEAFLLYFAGHGLPGESGGLHLALPDASMEHLYRALSFDRLRSVILTACKARHKVVILDTCFSGRAMKGGMGTPGVADFAEVDGTFLMTSSAENRPSMAPVGDRYTLFTGKFVDVLERGDPGAGDLLDMDTIYRAVDRSLRAVNGPPPQQRARNGGARITFVRNRAHTSPLRRGGSTSLAAVLPDGYEGLLHETVPGLVDRLQALTKVQGDAQTDAALTAVAGRWPEQQAAALLIELDSAGRLREATVACRAVAGRPAQEAAACVHVLDQLGAARVVDSVFEALFRTGPTTVAQVAGELLEHGPRMTERLVGIALVHGGPEGSADLVTALHRHGLGGEALAALHILMSKHPDPRYVWVADALLADGATESAYQVYVALPEALAASRPPEETARLLSSMAETGSRALAGTLLNALIAVPGDVGPVDWALALHTAGLDWADASARSLLGTASADDVLRILERVRRTRPTGVVTVVRWAIGDGRRSAADITTFTAALRSYGLPLDALRVLTETADSDLEKAAALIAMLRRGREDEALRLVQRAGERSVVDRITLVAALRAHGAHGEADQVVAGILGSPAEDLLPELPHLAEEVDMETLHAHIASSARAKHLSPLLVEYWRNGRPEDATRFLDLLAEREGDVLGETLSEFIVAHPPRPSQIERNAWEREKRSWLADCLPRIGLHTLVCITMYMVPAEPAAVPRFRVGAPLSAMTKPRNRELKAMVADALTVIRFSALLALIMGLRDRFPGPSEQSSPDPMHLLFATPPGGRRSSGSPLVWVLETALTGREDAPQLLSHLFEDRRHAPRITEELCDLMGTASTDRVVEIYWALVRSGRIPDESVLSGLRFRSDLSTVLEQLRRSGASRGDVMRVRRASPEPYGRRYDQAVEQVLEQAVGLYTTTVLRDAARDLKPYVLAELLSALVARNRAHDVDGVVAAAALRGPLESWLPDVLTMLCGVGTRDLCAQVIRTVVRRSRVADVANLVDVLRQDDMPDQARMLEEANRNHRKSRWLYR